MCVCVITHRLCIGFRFFTEEKSLCASQPKSKLLSKLQPSDSSSTCRFFFILIIFPSSLTFQLPYFVILWSLPGGNFCAGYDLKELANHTPPLKLEQDVTKGPGPMVSALCLACVCRRVISIFPYDFKEGKGSHEI